VSGPRIRPFGVLAVLIVLSLVLAACGSSSKPNANGPTTTVFSGTVPNGGTVVVGAEQEPDCFDWLGGCSGSSWGTWMAQIMTVPYAFRDVPKNGTLVEVPGAMLTGVPDFKPTPQETIT